MTGDPLSALIVPGTPNDVAAAYAALIERSRDLVFGFEDEIAIVDVETTGFDPDRDRIIEIAAAIMRGPQVIDRFDTLVEPGVSIPVEITTLTGIDDAAVAGSPTVDEAAGSFAAFVGERDLVAHNAPFDRTFLGRACGGELPGRWIDTLPLARIAFPRLRAHRLHDLATAFGAPVAPRHRAADDVEALAHVWRVIRCGIDELPPELLSRLVVLARSAPWSARSVLAHHAAATHASVPLDLAAARRDRVAAGRNEALSDADEVACAPPSAERVIAELGPDGVAGRMYEGFEQRAEQTRMAEAVLGAFADRTHVAVEAGTGVGKSVAYLVPAALFALENGVSVGVATKTNALMDQLVYHELPRLAGALSRDLRFVTLKGYEHYVCLRKLERFAADLDDTADSDRIDAAAMLLSWAIQSEWGDLDQVSMHWRRDVRQSVSASMADCTRKRCRFYPHLCYLHGVRRRAASAHVVVTNHALLFRDVVSDNALLPPIRHWVVDEAHAAEAEARSQLTCEAGIAEMRAALSGLCGRGRAGVLQAVRRELVDVDDAAGALGVIARMEESVERAQTLAESLFTFVKDLAPLAAESGYDQCDLRVSSAIRESGPWGTVAGVGASLARRLEQIVADGRHLMTLLEASGSDAGEVRADLAGLLSRIAEQQFGLTTVLDGENEGLVYWARLDRRSEARHERLVAARIDVGEALADAFYPRCHSVVFTSATLATGESFEHFAHAIGLDLLGTDAWSGLRLPSSYDLERQMAVFVPVDIPEPREVGYLDAIEELLFGVHMSMGGSVLTLLTNRRDLESLYDRLEPRLRLEGLPLIRQHRGTSAKRLREEFIAEEQLSLLALKSFWEGFDAKGDTLRCVVVPKLPFGRPTEPLAQERAEREGRTAWERYALPEAIIELKQAAGRLIRSKTDVGCLVIGDSRVLGRSYGRRFLEALPVADVEAAPTAEVLERVRVRFGREGIGCGDVERIEA